MAPDKSSSSKFFEVFGKITLVIIILSTIIFSAYYFGTQSKKDSGQQTSKVEDKNQFNPAGIVEEGSNEVDKDSDFINQKTNITINAGLSKSAGLSFDPYSIVTPSDWTSKKESQSAMDEKLILEKLGYSITISQAATGGALCLYPNDGAFEGPSSKFEVFTQVTTADGRELRRSGEKNGRDFTMCQKSPDNSFQQPTGYGHISIKIPSAWDEVGLKEVDSIIASLKKI